MRPGRKRNDRSGEDGHPFYGLGGLEVVTKEQADFCARRVGGLASFFEAHRPFKELLANAYWLGLQDAVEAFNARGLMWPEPPGDSP